MRIAFLCASLEPGRDGVGDYTRRLALACQRRGHDCRLFAVNDRFVSSFTAEPHPAGNPAVVRWPAGAPWAARVPTVRDALERFAPDRVSWQFVSYGFHPKGILPSEVIALARSLRTARTHVMLHEIWIGIAQGDSLLKLATGFRQRRRILAFLQAAASTDLQSSNPSYVSVLGRHGHAASVLPLFGNIPTSQPNPAAADAALGRHLRGLDPRQCLVATLFGTLHPEWDPRPAADWLLQAARRMERKPVVLAMGRGGNHGPRLLQQLEQAGIATRVTGELASEEVSRVLHGSDLGLSTHPWALIGKSGTVAAMRAHGLPTLVTRDDWRLRQGLTPVTAPVPGLARISDVSEADAPAWIAARGQPRDSVADTTDAFLAQLAA